MLKKHQFYCIIFRYNLKQKNMSHKSIFQWGGLLVLALVISYGALTQAQNNSSGPRFLQVADITSVSSSNPESNYPTTASGGVGYDNAGISIFIAPASSATSSIKTDGSTPECGHLGIQEWKGGTFNYTVADANTWQKRASVCSGVVVVGSSEKIGQQTLTVSGTTLENKQFTLQIQVPDPSTWDTEVGGGSRRLYVDDTGNTYVCKTPDYSSGWPNECNLSPTSAMSSSYLVGNGSGAVCGNNMCQYGESTSSCPADCSDTTAPVWPANATVTSSIVATNGVASVGLSWPAATDSNGVTQYKIFRDGVLLNTSGTTTYADTTISKSVNSYTYTVKAVDAAGNESVATPSVSVVLAPAAVTGVTAAVESSNTVRVSWTDAVINEAGFMIYRRKVADGTTGWLQDGSAPANATSYVQTNVTAGSYEYKVNAFVGTAPLDFYSPDGGTNVSSQVTVTSFATAGSDLVGHWRFDGNGTNDVASGPAASAYGQAEFRTSGGKFGGYAYIPTTTDYIKIPHTNTFYDLPISFTVELWFRQRADRGFVQDLVYKGSSNMYNFRIFRQLTNQYNFGPIITGYTDGTGSWKQTSNQNQLSHDVWHHVAFTKSSSSRAYYLDGVLIHSETDSPDANSAAADIYVGKNSFDTYIDNLKIYNRALSASEITQIGGFPTATTTTTAVQTVTTVTTTPTTTSTAPVVTTTTTPTTGTDGRPAAEDCSSSTGSSCQIEVGKTVRYTGKEWCNQGQAYYSKDTANMMISCVSWDANPPAGYSSCRPDDANCISAGSYGSGSGWCSQSMQCYKKGGKREESDYLFCAPTPRGNMTSASAMTTPECAAGYSYCSADDALCKQKGDRWETASTSNYCSNSRKCGLSNGGGVCVGWNESCPSGTKYCSDTPGSLPSSTYINNCIEPGEYRTVSTSDYGSAYCGFGGMPFYKKDGSKAYCVAADQSNAQTSGMLDAAGVKKVLSSIGSDWGFCPRNSTQTSSGGQCLEPGESGPSNSWCAWWPPNSVGTAPSMSEGQRTCPSLDGIVNSDPTKPVIITETIARECGPNEMPGMSTSTTSAPACIMPMYRWNYSEKRFVKCTAVDVQRQAVASTDSAYTSCEGMTSYDLEWKTEKNIVRPPEKYGQYYQPVWDATAKLYRYDYEKDELILCSSREMMPCTPAPEEDRGWILKQQRAQYKMNLLWMQNKSLTSGDNSDKTVVSVKPSVVEIPNIIDAKMCRAYFDGIKMSLDGDKDYFKSVAQQRTAVGSSYQGLEKLDALMKDARQQIVTLDKLIKKPVCTKENLQEIQSAFQKLRTEIFAQGARYLSEIQERLSYVSCRNNLEYKKKKILELILRKDVDDESRVVLKELDKAVTDKLINLVEHEEEFDIAFQCSEFTLKLEEQATPLISRVDSKLNQVVNESLIPRLAAVIDQLEKQLEENGKRLDELLLKVGELHEAVDLFGKTAEKVSERIAVSLSALTGINDKFAEERAQMQNAKGQIVPAVDEALRVIKEQKCVDKKQEEMLVQELANAATINWIGERGGQVNDRIKLLVNSCIGQKVAIIDIDALVGLLQNYAKANQEAVYKKGITPWVDVPPHEWYFSAMNRGHDTGFITQGRPAENVLRQDALIMVLRANGATDSEISGKNCELDTRYSVSEYARCAAATGVKRGMSLPFELMVKTDRAEVARWIVTLTKLPKESSDETLKSYADISGLSPVDRDAVAAVVANEIMVGNVHASDSTFTPHAPLTRAALAVILDKILGLK